MNSKKKILVVSHRLPVTVKRKGNELLVSPSVGGLATGLSSVSQTHQVIWMGYPGIAANTMNAEEKEYITRRLTGECGCLPVFLTTEEINPYYNGYSNNTLWPLFHYFPVYAQFSQETWRGYRAVNHAFARRMEEEAADADMIWVHDYQLLLLPALLRERFPDKKIGFFLHIPFPSFEIFRLIPERRELIDGLLGADVIGFHTWSYLRHFLSSVLRLTGHEHTLGLIQLPRRRVKAEVFPMGIAYERYANTGTAAVKREIRKIKKAALGRRIIISIDRLDYTKGIKNRLAAIDCFLGRYPEHRGEVEFILVTVPSRTAVGRYQDLKTDIEKTVGAINGRYSTLDWAPIRYLYTSLSFSTILALYASADIALVTPLRDGMNLVAKEYIAAKGDAPGAIILSELAGAAEELGEAYIVNPFDSADIALQLKNALTAPDAEKVASLKSMQQRLQKYNLARWADDFLGTLERHQPSLPAQTGPADWRTASADLVARFRRAAQRTLVLDYDGTLVPFHKNPDAVAPDKALLATLHTLAALPRTAVIIISGRTREYLDRWFKDSELMLVAEHGIWERPAGGQWKMPFPHDDSWKETIRAVLDHYTRRTPGTFVEEKEYSLCWHYRKADPEFARLRLNEMKMELLHLIANINLGMLEGKKVLEIKGLDINKGKIVSRLPLIKRSDFILCLGDDLTDEDMFHALPPESFTVKVGPGSSEARFSMASHEDSRHLLETLAGEGHE